MLMKGKSKEIIAIQFNKESITKSKNNSKWNHYISNWADNLCGKTYFMSKPGEEIKKITNPIKDHLSDHHKNTALKS